MEDSAESDSDASRCSFATAASMEDLITASESNDSERGLTKAGDEGQELVCALHDLPGPARDAGGRWGPHPLRARWEAFHMLTRERRDQAARDHAEGLASEQFGGRRLCASGHRPDSQ
ncbi:hypothetical protein CYMTET_42354 [Cymbomonas tetramitiformis]|uniref:Uncharacterized protein n=1 Tax=Cymbomonas tetramitiformis TaxID=36881 RepID=A0AAE0C4D4_9CHLO|nr:hypothetical protein CYMTET_42354 [Cymbomonas tetramitiformis]